MTNMPANIRISAQFPFPSGVAGTTPIAITKANGIWSVALPLGALATQLPAGGSLTTDYVLVWDSLSGTYFKMPISNIPTGPAGPPGAAGPPGPSGGITDAPSDGVNYGRKNAAWNNLDTIYAPIATVGVTCRAHSTVNQTGIATNTYTKVNISTADFDAHSMFDAVNHRITPNVAGIYLVTGGVYITPSIAGDLLATQAVIYKNGAADRYATLAAVTSPSEALPSVSDLVQMNGTTDYVELWAEAFLTGGTATFNSGAAFTTLSVARVGP